MDDVGRTSRAASEPFCHGEVFTAKAASNMRLVSRPTNEAVIMLGWAITFLIVALIAGILGFGGVAIISVEIAKIIFVVAIVLFLISAVFGFMRGRSSPMP
jgi:uncharacterized membrane protein YtjA (UPF0391 family)